MPESPRLLIYGGTALSYKSSIGGFPEVEERDLQSSLHLTQSGFEFGVGRHRDRAFMVFRQAVMSGNRTYPFVVLLDPGEEVWSRLGWNAAWLISWLLAEHVRGGRLLSPSRSSDILPAHLAGILDQASDARKAWLEQLREFGSTAHDDREHPLPKLFAAAFTAWEGVAEITAEQVGLGDRPDPERMAELIEYLPPPFRVSDGWLVGTPWQGRPMFGARILVAPPGDYSVSSATPPDWGTVLAAGDSTLAVWRRLGDSGRSSGKPPMEGSIPNPGAIDPSSLRDLARVDSHPKPLASGPVWRWEAAPRRHLQVLSRIDGNTLGEQEADELLASADICSGPLASLVQNALIEWLKRVQSDRDMSDAATRFLLGLAREGRLDLSGDPQLLQRLAPRAGADWLAQRHWPLTHSEAEPFTIDRIPQRFAAELVRAWRSPGELPRLIRHIGGVTADFNEKAPLVEAVDRWREAGGEDLEEWCFEAPPKLRLLLDEILRDTAVEMTRRRERGWERGLLLFGMHSDRVPTLYPRGDLDWATLSALALEAMDLSERHPHAVEGFLSELEDRLYQIQPNLEALRRAAKSDSGRWLIFLLLSRITLRHWSGRSSHFDPHERPTVSRIGRDSTTELPKAPGGWAEFRENVRQVLSEISGPPRKGLIKRLLGA